MSEVALEGITKRFGEVEAVTDVSLAVRDGELLVLVGPSGCGKTSILRTIAGLDAPTRGEVYFDGTRVTDLPARKRDVGFVFEDFALFPHLNVRENVSFNLRMRGGYDAVDDRVERTARLLDIGDLLDRRVDELSGGQKQRVALGRAIASEPRAFLLDEPFANLDAELRSRMQTEIARLQDELDVTTVHVTHDQEEALSMGDRIAVMNDGTIQQVGPPEEIYARPANLFVARFVGTPAMNLLRGRVASGSSPAAVELDGPGAAIPIGGRDVGGATELVVGVRPEHVTVEDGGRDGAGGLPATIEYDEFHGADRFVHARVEGDVEIVARVEGERKLEAGSEASLSFDADRVHLFDPASGTRVPDPGAEGGRGTVDAESAPNRADPS